MSANFFPQYLSILPFRMSHYPDSEYATLVTTGWLQVAAISPLAAPILIAQAINLRADSELAIARCRSSQTPSWENLSNLAIGCRPDRTNYCSLLKLGRDARTMPKANDFFTVLFRCIGNHRNFDRRISSNMAGLIGINFGHLLVCSISLMQLT